jgi:hypothetical protein
MEVRYQAHTPATLPWVSKPATFYTYTVGWLSPTTGLDVVKKRIISCPFWESNPDPLAVYPIAYSQ